MAKSNETWTLGRAFVLRKGTFAHVNQILEAISFVPIEGDFAHCDILAKQRASSLEPNYRPGGGGDTPL